MKKTVLITGASSGFGLMLAETLHRQGFEVIGTSREPARHAGSLPFRLLRLDVCDDASVRAFTDDLFRCVPTVDVLINNAGFMVTGVAEETPVALGRQQFETNFWGTVKVTNALLPHFRSRRQGRIITVSSMVGLIGQPNLAYYAASKHAVEGYFKSLRFELEPFGIQVSLVEPQWFKTNLLVHAESAARECIPDYDAYRMKADALTRNGMDQADAPDAVVRRIVRLIDMPRPGFRNPVGKLSSVILFLQSYFPSLFEREVLKSVRTAA